MLKIQLQGLGLHRLAEEQLLPQVIAAVTRLSRDANAEVKCGACRAAGALASAELEQRLQPGSALQPTIGIMTALLGPDQASEVQRQQMQVRHVTHVQHVKPALYAALSVHAACFK